MSTTADSLQDCIWSVETHHFDNICVKCVFKCKNPGYKTYSGLHKHYLNVHNICLHRVARLDPNNEDEFRRNIASSLAHLAGGSRGGRAIPYVYNPSVAGPSLHSAGPSHLRGHRTPGTTSHPTPASLGQESPENPPSWYAGHTPIENPRQNHSPGSRLPVLGEVGPFRSPPIYPTTRHQPYPQYRPQQQGMYTNQSPARSQAKGKGREIPSTPMNCGLPTPDTPSQGNRLEKSTLSTTGPDNAVFMRSHQHSSVDAGYPTTAGTSIHPERSPPSRYPVDTIVSGNFRRPVNAQEHIPPIDSPRGPEGPIPAGHAWHRPEAHHQQLHPTATGFFNHTECLPTPPVDTNPLPDGSPRRPLQEQPRDLPRRISQKRRSESLSPPATGSSSPQYPAKQLASHPYPRPAKGSTTSRLVRQAHENRQRDLSLSTEADVTKEVFTHVTPPLEEGQSRGVDVRYPQAAALSTDRQNYPANPQVPPTPSYIHLPGRHAPLRSEEPTPPACSTSRSNSATESQGQPQLRGTRQVNDVQSLGEPSTTWRRLDIPESCGSAQAQEPSGPAVSGPVERLKTADESTPPTSVVQEPNQEPTPTKRRVSDICHPTEGANEMGGGLRREEPAQNVFPEISWEGWGLVKTPDGFYLPETFNPFPHELEDLTDQW